MLNWQYVWNKFNTMLADECSEGRLDEEKLEQILDVAQLTNNVESLLEVASEHGYDWDWETKSWN